MSTATATGILRLDLGCGKRKEPGFVGVDSREFEGVDFIVDLRKPWPWADDSVEEVRCSHFLEHLTAQERAHFANELYRVLRPGGKALIVVPHWNSCRAYGDLTHEWPPVSEFFFPYLSREWRLREAPHTDGLLRCDFDHTLGYNLNAGLNAGRSQEFQQFAAAHYREACLDVVATLTKRWTPPGA